MALQFLDIFLKKIPQSSNILDLGSGDGQQSCRFTELGHSSIMLDVKAPLTIIAGAEWIQVDLGSDDYKKIKYDKVDAIFCKNLLNHLTKTQSQKFISSHSSQRQ